ncbi:Protein SFK1 [Nakaseomyces bracarensis]|uniref:Protein SFK1 n=1 Tax=Nakaseomyces bracarensis TaxID=273131 RepID=A0ABR4NRZ1_9SACH
MRFRKPENYFFIVPWVAFIPWYGMLIAMLVCWAAQGHPIYWFMHTEQFPVYISDIGATNLRPLFISCAGWQGLGYVISVACEYFQRAGRWPFRIPGSGSSKAAEQHYNEISSYTERILNSKLYMPPYFIKHERNLIFASFILGCIGEIALLMCSIFSTAKYHHVHIAMVCIFCIFMLLSIVCLTAEYFSMGRHYAAIHPLAASKPNYDPQHPTAIDSLPNSKWTGYVWNKFTISATLKTIWCILAIIWAICFGAIHDNSRSACFEWLLAFWFGVIFMIISADFYIGGLYKKSKYFHQIESFAGYYKYDRIAGVNNELWSSSTSTRAEEKDRPETLASS